MQADELGHLEIGALPGVKVSGWGFASELPTLTSAIYFLVSEKHGLLYIGKASDLRVRWWNYHHCKEDALKLGDCTLHWLVIPRDDLRTVELALIRIHNTPWNQESKGPFDPRSQLNNELGRLDPNRFRRGKQTVWSKRKP